MEQTVIKILSPQVANQIAAGEVVERPASVVKELCENSLDAKAKHIIVEIVKGGIKSLKISDDGIGMIKDDLILAFEPHATSKLKEIDDLLAIKTNGFRGEALSSIASVAKVVAKSRTQSMNIGYSLLLEGGEVLDLKAVSMNYGTQIEIKDLFYNTPARYKFLKKDQTEADKIREVIIRLALANPEVSFTFIQDKKTIFQSPGNNKLSDAIYAILGPKIHSELLPIKVNLEDMNSNSPIKIEGYIGQTQYAKKSRSSQFFFVNKRPVKSSLLNSVMDEVYKNRLMKGLYPSCILLLECSGHKVDVNVHPQKLEVRFADSAEVFQFLYKCIEQTLVTNDLPPQEMPKTRTEHEKQTFTNSKSLMEGEYVPLKKHNELYQKNQLEIASNQFESLYKNVAVIETDNFKVGEGIIEYQGNTDSKDLNSRIKDKALVQEKHSGVWSENRTEDKVDCEDKAGLAKNSSDKYSEAKENENQQVLNQLNLDNSNNKIDNRADSLIKNDNYKLSEMEIVGVAFNTFIILAKNDILYLIDQHAAHEKIIFEKLYKSYLHSKPLPSQILLTPYELFVSSSQLNLIKEKKEVLSNFGFEIDDFTERTLLVRAIPENTDVISLKSLLDDTIAFLEKNQWLNMQNNDINNQYAYHYLAEVACKKAVKANDYLSNEEIKQLILDLEKLDNPQHCPHGRPIVIQITRTELNKRFKRIVG